MLERKATLEVEDPRLIAPQNALGTFFYELITGGTFVRTQLLKVICNYGQSIAVEVKPIYLDRFTSNSGVTDRLCPPDLAELVVQMAGQLRDYRIIDLQIIAKQISTDLRELGKQGCQSEEKNQFILAIDQQPEYFITSAKIGVNLSNIFLSTKFEKYVNVFDDSRKKGMRESLSHTPNEKTKPYTVTMELSAMDRNSVFTKFYDRIIEQYSKNCGKNGIKWVHKKSSHHVNPL